MENCLNMIEKLLIGMLRNNTNNIYVSDGLNTVNGDLFQYKIALPLKA